MAFSFDGPNKRINISAATEISLRDLWSRWVDWVLTSDNSKYALAFSQVGGNDIDLSAGTYIPIYLFLLNGWKIKPQESSHTLAVQDGVLVVDGGGDPFVNTTGSYVVRINYQQPVQAIAFSTGGASGPSAATIATAVWDEVLEAAKTARQLMRLIAAGAGGDTVDMDTTTARVKSLDGSKDRVVATLDGAGNRTVVSRDLD